MTFADGTWIAEVPDLPGEAAMELSLSNALTGVRQLILHVFDAPAEVAGGLRRKVTLDAAAADVVAAT